MGVWNVAAMEEEMTLSQFYMWLAYNRVEPIDPWRSDFRVAVSTSNIVNALIGLFAKRGSRKTKIEDLIPNFNKKKVKGPKAIWNQLMMMARLTEKKPEDDE